MPTATEFLDAAPNANAFLDAPAPKAEEFLDAPAASVPAAPAPFAAKPVPTEWANLYGGLDGLDSRLPNDQKAAFNFLDSNVANPKESRAHAINRAYIQDELKLPGEWIDSNWATVKDSYAKQTLGMDVRDITDEGLYDAIGKRMKQTAFAKTDQWKNATPHQRFEMLMGNFGKYFGATTEKTMAQQTKPFVALPEAPEDLPFEPAMGIFSPNIVGGVYNSMFKPFAEGLESPLGVGTLGVGGLMGAASKAGVSGAGAAVKGMQWIFAVAMGKAAVEQTPEMARIVADPDASAQKKIEAVGAVAMPAVMALAGAVTTLGETAPKAAKALEGKSVDEILTTLHEEAAKAKTVEEKVAIHETADAVMKSTEEPPPVEPPPAPADPTIVQTPTGEVVKVTETPPATEEAPPEPAMPKAASAEPTVGGTRTFEDLVGIKNEAVDAEMASMGHDPAEHGPRIKWEEAKADALAKLAADPFAGQKFVKSLAENPRPITGQEDALLLAEVNRLRLERDAAEQQLNEAKAAGNRDAVEEANLRIAAARDAFTQASETATRVGTPQAQGLALRRMMMREDYSIASLERQLAAETADGKLTPEQVEQVREFAKKIRETDEDLAKYNARRLKAAKTRMAKATAELKERVEKGDLGPRPKPEPIELDAEGELLKAAHERAKQEFDRAVLTERIKNRSTFERGQNALVKWRRGFLLSNPVTLAKLTAAAAWRVGASYAEEAAGSMLSKLPGVSKVAKRASRYGAMNSEAEAAAITEAFTTGMRDAYNVIRTGKSNLDVIYGKGAGGALGEHDIAPRSVIDFFGSLHGALKAPVKRMEFARSFQKRAAFEIRNGVDVSNPMVQTRIAVEAYKDANRAIFMQDNMLTDAYKRGLSALEQVDPKTGKTKSPSGKALATGIRMALPIVKVPTNIVAETFEYATGSLTGSWKLGRALAKGVNDLPPEQANLIMRNLQKGSLGAATLLLGYFSADKLGALYQKGEKRKPNEPKANEIQVYGENVPAYLLHAPVIETLQLGATIQKVAESKLKKRDKEEQGIGSGVFAAALGLVEDVPFAREAEEYTKLFDPNERQYEAGQIAKDLIDPQLLQWAARVSDMRNGEVIKRKPSTIGEAVKTGIPVLRKTVPEAKRDPSTTYRK